MRENRVELIRKAVLEKDNSLLTPELVQLRQQLEFAFKLLIDGSRTSGEVVQALMEEFGLKNEVTAYARIRDAKALYGDVVKANRQVEAHVQYMRAEGIYRRAMDNDNMEVALKAVDTMAKIRGLDKEDLNAIDPSKLEAHQYQLQLDPRMEQFVKLLLGSGRINLTELMGDVPVAEIVQPPSPEALEGRTTTPEP